MKLGIFLLIIGVLIAGAGMYAWQYYEPTFLGLRTHEEQQFFSAGMGAMVVGGGLVIGGIIRMVVKR
jgi:uncharacterized membrane protein YidH (DUF202 family)